MGWAMSLPSTPLLPLHLSWVMLPWTASLRLTMRLLRRSGRSLETAARGRSLTTQRCCRRGWETGGRRVRCSRDYLEGHWLLWGRGRQGQGWQGGQQDHSAQQPRWERKFVFLLKCVLMFCCIVGPEVVATIFKKGDLTISSNADPS